MKYKITTVLIKYILVLILLVFPVATSVYSQTISTPTFPFSAVCASPTFNTFNVTFTFSPTASFQSTNQFNLELSDSTGSFANPTILVSSPVGVNTSPKTLTFAIPTTVGGENYKIRIKSTAPVVTSPSSISFPAYYKSHDQQFWINNKVATGTFCPGGGFTLSIDNPTDPSSPAFYPSLTYKWYKNNVLITGTGTSGPSYVATTIGDYRVETNYGTCTSNSYSNIVTVSQGTGTAVVITSSAGNTICSGTPITLSTESGHTYQWSKDGVIISGATSYQYVANQSGTYSVNVNLGGCVSNPSFILQGIQITGAVDLISPGKIVVGETKTITATTNAVNPTYQWYLGTTAIIGATNSSYDVTAAGTYKVVITQTSGCVVSKEVSFVLNGVTDATVIPNLVSPNGDGNNDFWEIPQIYAGADVMILNSQGDIVLKTSDYQNNWPENQINFTSVNPVYYYIISKQGQGEKKGSITLVK